MSYYSRPSYNFTYHGLQRCKERLKLQDRPDYEVKEIVYKLIKEARDIFETANEIYISAGKNLKLYFIVNKKNNLIITCTPMSVEKQMKLVRY